MSPDGLASLKGRVGRREVLARKSRHFDGVDLLASRVHKLYAMHALLSHASASEVLGAWLSRI